MLLLIINLALWVLYMQNNEIYNQLKTQVSVSQRYQSARKKDYIKVLPIQDNSLNLLGLSCLFLAKLLCYLQSVHSSI